MSAASYSIVRTIAAGGMGTVYLARREGAGGFERLVAMKRANADLADDPTTRRRLVAEASAASRIHHANVVSVIDLVERGGELWLVLDWVDGASLARLCELSGGARLPADIAVRIVLDACAGLAAAHELVGAQGEPAGLRHRDVSPQNILVGRDGVARLADFGLAKSLDATLTATSDRLLEGKLGYVAPELFSGRPFEAGCDLYAMAVVAWETLAGRRLFRGKSLRDLAREQAAPPPLSSVAGGALAVFDAVLGAALAADPATRPASVRAFLESFERAAKARGSIATSLDVATAVAVALGERRDHAAEDTAKTPTTGPMDPPITSVTSGTLLLEDAPTPLAPDDALTRAEMPEPPPPLIVPAQDEPRTVVTAPMTALRPRRGRALPWVGGAAGVGVAALLAARVLAGPSEQRADTGQPMAGAEAIATSSAPAPPAVVSAEPSPAPVSASSASAEVLDLDASASAPRPRVEVPAIRSAPAAKVTPKTSADPVTTVPKNPYRKP